MRPTTIYTYRTRGNFPSPDVTLGQSNGWYPETLDRWKAGRPGRTGRPKKGEGTGGDG